QFEFRRACISGTADHEANGELPRRLVIDGRFRQHCVVGSHDAELQIDRLGRRRNSCAGRWLGNEDGVAPLSISLRSTQRELSTQLLVDRHHHHAGLGLSIGADDFPPNRNGVRAIATPACANISCSCICHLDLIHGGWLNESRFSTRRTQRTRRLAAPVCALCVLCVEKTFHISRFITTCIAIYGFLAFFGAGSFASAASSPATPSSMALTLASSFACIWSDTTAFCLSKSSLLLLLSPLSTAIKYLNTSLYFLIKSSL